MVTFDNFLSFKGGMKGGGIVGIIKITWSPKKRLQENSWVAGNLWAYHNLLKQQMTIWS